MNNKVYYVQDATGAKYVLRVYNNGFNKPRVAYEHAVLTALAGSPFSFEIPTLVKTVDGTATSVSLSTGTDACLFKLISGGPAKLSDARVIGSATAELVAGMAGLRIDLPLPNPLYRNSAWQSELHVPICAVLSRTSCFPILFAVYEAHHKITRPLFFEIVAGPALESVRADMDYLIAELLRAESLVQDILKMERPLPEQMVRLFLGACGVGVELFVA